MNLPEQGTRYLKPVFSSSARLSSFVYVSTIAQAVEYASGSFDQSRNTYVGATCLQNWPSQSCCKFFQILS